MKKILLITILLSSIIFSATAREYNYLNPPSISIMDFDVNMSEVTYGESDSQLVGKDYYGKLINQTLLTILIQKNSDNQVLISGDDIASVTANDKMFNNARYFPTLLKIYDKKYVESALGDNNFTVGDLYSKNADAFDYADLDFVVLGNVYETSDQIGVNVRVLNTARGEELFSYIGFIDNNLTNLNRVCENIAENIITDLLKNYCSQFIIKIKDNTDTGKDPIYFCQSSQEYDNEDNTISYNDTFKKGVFSESYYWILPGDYVFTVYSKTNKSVHEIPVTIDPREIKIIEVNEEHFEVDTGTLTIGGIFPTDAYSVNIKEKVKDAEYLWEIGEMKDSDRKNYRFTFNAGEFDHTYDDQETDKPLWIYNSFNNEIYISNLMISQYDVTVTPVAESIKRKGITGIVYISSKEIETSDEVSVNLDSENDEKIEIADFNIRKASNGDSYQQTRITFLFNPAFDGEKTELFVDSQGDLGYLLIRNIEKLVVEDEYSKEEWENLAGKTFLVEMERDGEYYSTFLSYDGIEAEDDKIIVAEFKRQAKLLTLDSSGTAAGTSVAAQEERGIINWFKKVFGGNE